KQLHILEQYCAERGLTVNVSKTRVMLLAGEEGEAEAVARAQQAGITYAATVLAEAGQLPLYITWLMSATRLWSTVVAAPQGSIMQQVLDAGLQMAAECQGGQIALAKLPWIAQLQQAMSAVGVDFDPQQRAALQPAAVRQAALQQYLQRVAAAAARPGASQLRHYFGDV
ncbi:hypothetical protein ABPG75_003246, partial [Micractinium tetrahymenae]